MAEISNVVPLKGRKGSPPSTLNGKVPPPRRKNKDVRSREHLTPDEVERLITSAKSLGRHGHRDATLILMDYRHGLRVILFYPSKVLHCLFLPCQLSH